MQNQVSHQRVVLAVPPGLEVAGIKIVRRENGSRFEQLGTGLIESKDTVGDPLLSTLLEDAPIWTFGSFRVIRKEVALGDDALPTIAAAIEDSVATLGWQDKSYWLDAGPGATQGWAKQLLKRRLGINNNPSNYQLTLKICGSVQSAHILLGRSISVKRRFAYRKADVGASINPVLAACLARLMPRELDGRAIDPTCGSGTLLFERLRYSLETSGLGMDISPIAREAFTVNLPHTGLSERPIKFRLASSADAASWQSCSSVVCNLPFGIRTRVTVNDLNQLYRSILENAEKNLSAHGRILLTSSYKRGLERAADAVSNRLRVLSKYRAEMGGLVYQVFVLART